MRNSVRRVLAALAVLFVLTTAAAREAPSAAPDPALERRVMDLATELRCLVCQNQTIADSNAALAVDLRNQIRELLRGGSSEREVIDYMVARYGDFVLYRPPFKATTALLWLGPLLLLAAGLALLYRTLSRRPRNEEPPLSAEEHQRAQALLDEGTP